MPELVNPTDHFLRKIHTFDIFNNELNERVHIDVLEYLDADRKLSVAIPYSLGYKAGDEICGEGECVNSALNDCLAKISKVSWKEFMNLSGGREKSEDY